MRGQGEGLNRVLETEVSWREKAANGGSGLGSEVSGDEIGLYPAWQQCLAKQNPLAPLGAGNSAASNK